jgi:hypothetical protein
MPKIIIEVSDAWLDRLQQVLPAAIDTLYSFEHQCRRSIIDGSPDPPDLIEQLLSQIIDLRRTIEAVRIIF